jgi:hypothetical protein
VSRVKWLHAAGRPRLHDFDRGFLPVSSHSAAGKPQGNCDFNK